jgi:hypothetical protein
MHFIATLKRLFQQLKVMNIFIVISPAIHINCAMHTYVQCYNVTYLDSQDPP